MAVLTVGIVLVLMRILENRDKLGAQLGIHERGIADFFDALVSLGFLHERGMIPRRTNNFGLLISLNMLVELGDGFDFTGADFSRWADETGFKQTAVMPLAGPTSAVIAFK